MSMSDGTDIAPGGILAGGLPVYPAVMNAAGQAAPKQDVAGDGDAVMAKWPDASVKGVARMARGGSETVTPGFDPPVVEQRGGVDVTAEYRDAVLVRMRRPDGVDHDFPADGGTGTELLMADVLEPALHRSIVLVD